MKNEGKEKRVSVVRELSGRVLHPGDPGWDEARHGFGARFDYDANQPRVIVFCQNAHDVANAVKWARQHKVPLRARCGRHNYEGYSSLVKDGIIVDVSEMESVRVDSQSGEAWLGAGLDMLQLTEMLSDSGMTLPLATSPSVGLAGLTLGGGFGINSRTYGLTCDSLLEVELVNAKGQIIHANAEENPDLLWACKGGGGNNFGIVTAFKFKVYPASLVVAFNVTWPWDQFDKVVNLWQRWAHEAEDGITSLLSLTVAPSITLVGQYTAAPQDLPRLYQLLEPLLSATIPASVSINVVPQVVAARSFFGVDPINPQWAVRQHNDRQIFKSSSALAFEFFDVATITQLREHLEAVPPLSAPPSQPSMIQLLGGGGAAARIAPEATAVVHRKAKFLVQYDAYWTAPQDAEPTLQWIREFREVLSPYAYSAYVNYVDEQLKNPLRQYYGDNLERLVQIKKQYDPGNFFHFPQSIPTAL